MKTKFVEYKKGEPWSCGKCCHLQSVLKERASCVANGWLCSAGSRKDGRNGYFVEVKEKKVAKMSKKKQTVVQTPQKKNTIADMVGKFIAIEAFGTSEEFNVKESDILGIFDTEKQAIDHICEDTKENFEADNEASIHVSEDWASNCLIVEIKRVVRPVITASVTCEAKEVAR